MTWDRIEATTDYKDGKAVDQYYPSQGYYYRIYGFVGKDANWAGIASAMAPNLVTGVWFDGKAVPKDWPPPTVDDMKPANSWMGDVIPVWIEFWSPNDEQILDFPRTVPTSKGFQPLYDRAAWKGSEGPKPAAPTKTPEKGSEPATEEKKSPGVGLVIGAVAAIGLLAALAGRRK